MTQQGRSVLELTVNNHPGVMSHVCGLFTRRGYNLEGILVMPIHSQHDQQSRIWLLVNEEDKLGQVIRQTEKLVDVLSIERRVVNDSVFTHMEDYFRHQF
jgi:acetolactate synthase-1/3 small subunit